MKNLEEFADAMADEALRESAENYFSRRVAIEDEIEHLRKGFEELHRIEFGLTCLAELVRRILLDDETEREFYAMLEVEPPRYPRDPNLCMRISAFRIPFALTIKGRYTGMILDRYRRFDAAIDAYLHGRHVEDPFLARRKVQTVNLEMLTKRCADVNAMIEGYNASHATESVLQFAKSMNAAAVANENVIGGGLAERYDNMDYKPVDMAAENFAFFPDLPHIDKAGDRIKAFCAKVYAAKTDKVRALMHGLRRRR